MLSMHVAQSHQVMWEGHQTHWTVEWMLRERWREGEREREREREERERGG